MFEKILQHGRIVQQMSRPDFLHINYAFLFPIYIGSYLMIYDSLVFIKYQFGSVCIFISFSESQQQRIHIFVQAAQIF